MFILVAIVLAIFGISILALRLYFGVFPNNWEWVGIILAGLGLLMGAPSIFQMAMGRPELKVQFDSIVEGDERRLAIFLKNQQLGNPLEGKKSIWRKLGVKRDTIESLTVSFRIVEAGTGNIIVPIMQAEIYSDDAIGELGAWRTTLPPTMSFQTNVIIAVWDKHLNKVVILGDRTKSSVELSSGIYEIIAMVATDGDPQYFVNQFVVGTTAEELTWVKTNPYRKKMRKMLV